MRAAVLAALLPLTSAAGAAEWRTAGSSALLAAARERVALLPAPPAGPVYATPDDWPRAKALLLAELAKLQSWNSRPEIRKIVRELTQLAEEIEAREREEADRKIALFARVPVAGETSADLAARAELVFRARMLHVYGFLLPQAVNEGFEGDSGTAGLPFPLYDTNADFCRDWAPIGWELRDLVLRADPSFFPPDPTPRRAICDPAEALPSWRGLRRRPLPR